MKREEVAQGAVIRAMVVKDENQLGNLVYLDMEREITKIQEEKAEAEGQQHIDEKEKERNDMLTIKNEIKRLFQKCDAQLQKSEVASKKKFQRLKLQKIKKYIESLKNPKKLKSFWSF
ncbi:hypothetical protein RFI_37248, partial [Reticulomyxa filosa]